MLTIQTAAVPKHGPPLQPPKVEGAVGLAVRVTVVLAGKVKLQVDPQSMPVGALVTLPVPVPALLTVKPGLPDELNVAVTFWAVLMVTVQVNVVPEQAPLQPAKVEGAMGLAVSVTVVLMGKA